MPIIPFCTSWIPVVAWAGIIFFLSNIPSLDSGLGMWDLILRKCAHVGEYAVLTALLVRAFRTTWPHVSPRKIIVWCFVIALVYAASDEWHQSFVPGRGPSVVDVMIDGVGIVSLSLYFWMKEIRELKNRVL